MSQVRAAILTRWIQEVEDGLPAYRLALPRDIALPAGEPCLDVTGGVGLPSPNVVIVEVQCSHATLQAIRDHPNYGADAILYVVDADGDERKLVVGQAYYDRVVTKLAQKFGRTESQVRTVLTNNGATVGMTRLAFWQAIIGYLRTRPKA